MLYCTDGLSLLSETEEQGSRVEGGTFTVGGSSARINPNADSNGNRSGLEPFHKKDSNRLRNKSAGGKLQRSAP